MQIGDKIWCHDYRSNSRRWFEDEITGETRQSWLIGRVPYKVNKKTMLENCGQWGNRQWYTPAAKYVKEWLTRHAMNIADHVSTCKDVDALLKIADLIDYKVDPPKLP